MPKLEISVPHRLSQGEALRRVEDLLPAVEQEFAGKVTDLQQRWQGNTGTFQFKTKGGKVSGTLTVSGTEVELIANLPFAANFFKGTIEEAIRKRASTLLA